MNDLPLPSKEALEHSKALTQYIQAIITQKGGKIPFEEYMSLALYAPKLGYYTAGSQKFGQSGDFVTAPEISPLFGQSLGYFCKQVLDNLSHNTKIILELGAGSGKLACDILQYLTKTNTLPQAYWILEVSADLKARQQEYLLSRCPDFFPHIHWLSALPAQPFDGIILANEIIDAMPVHLFEKTPKLTLTGISGEETTTVEHPEIYQNSYQEIYVENQNEHFGFINGPLSSDRLKMALEKAIDNKLDNINSPYQSEILLNLTPWIQSLADALASGVMLFIDYGFGGSEYYHPSRNQGTLMCHYRHHAHSDVFLYPGLQDITAHVNFSAVAAAAEAAKLSVLYYNNQANFLIANQLLAFTEQNFTLENRFQLSQQIQTLLQPHEMGELFKVMVLNKNFSGELNYLNNQSRYDL